MAILASGSVTLVRVDDGSEGTPFVWNLLKDTYDPGNDGTTSGDGWNITSGGNGTYKYVDLSEDTSVPVIGGIGIRNNTSGNRDMTQLRYDLEKGKTYTASWYARVADDSTNVTMMCRIWNQTSSKRYLYLYNDTITNTDWERFSCTWTHDTDASCSIKFGMSGTGDIDICGMKLEEGDTVSTWAPAYDEIFGTGVEAVTAYYAVTESTTFYPTHGGDTTSVLDTAVLDIALLGNSGEWVTTMPTVGENEYLWACYLVEYSDGTTEWTEPYRITDESTRESVAEILKTQTDILANVDNLIFRVSSNTDAISEIKLDIDSISLSVTGELGGTASITMTVGDNTVTKDLDLSGVREAFAKEASSITIAAGTVAFAANTLIVDSDNFTLNSDGTGTIANFTIDTNAIHTTSLTAIGQETSGVYVGIDGYYNAYDYYYDVDKPTAFVIASTTIADGVINVKNGRVIANDGDENYFSEVTIDGGLEVGVTDYTVTNSPLGGFSMDARYFDAYAPYTTESWLELDNKNSAMLLSDTGLISGGVIYSMISCRASAGSTTYHVPLGTVYEGDEESDERARVFHDDGFNYSMSVGTTSTTTPGYATLRLGNDTEIGTAGNKAGLLRMYSQNSYFYSINAATDISGTRVLYLPKVSDSSSSVTAMLVSAARDSKTGNPSAPIYIDEYGYAVECDDVADAGGTNLIITVNQPGIRFYDSSGNAVTMLYLSAAGNFYVGNTNYDMVLRGETIASNVAITTSSDVRLKHDIEDLSDKYIAFLDAMEPVRFKYNDNPRDVYHNGYLAGDVLSAAKSAGLEESEVGLYSVDMDGYAGLAYPELIPMLHAKIKQLETRVAQLEGE